MDRAFYNVTPEELFDLFGKYGPIRQVRQGIASNTKGTAFVVYEDVMDAKQACDKLNGYNFQNRYLVVLYHQPDKMARTKEDLDSSESTQLVWRPVLSDISLRGSKGGVGAKGAQVDL
ncbi:pre-mRNA branch site protein p14 [Chaetomidium leptoderma]|uniref:Pre-mRNA branch site protein p14 n=1 Tax=Chaetomidium leptoderma TaxID=669021 RepID=A0AAN6VCL0_9PEZI|nr:pre-mRNA branch site protein p14 [Chaetomidium leptoderma]